MFRAIIRQHVTSASRARRALHRPPLRPVAATRRPTVSACQLERLYNYGTLFRVR